MKKFGKRLVMAGLCLTLCTGMLAGCGNNDKAIATLDGEKTAYAVANIMLRYNQAQMQTYYGAYMGEDMWSSYGETIKTSMADTLKQCLVLEKHMADYDITISDEDKAKIADAAEQFLSDNDEKVLKALGATNETMERVLTLYLVQARMTEAIEAEADMNVTDEEAAQKTIEYVQLATTTTGDDGSATAMSDEEKAAVLEKAKQIRDAAAGGQELADAVTAVDETLSSSTASYGDNDAEEDATLDEAVRTAASKLADGEVADDVVETDDAYYVIKMKSVNDAEATATKKESIIADRKQAKFDEVYDAWVEDADYKQDDKLLAKMTFDDTYEVWMETETETETGTETGTEADTEAE